jgi:hypothetical protein
MADDLFDLRTYRFKRDPERLEGLRGHSFALMNQTKQDVLSPDVVVVQEARFLLGQHHNPAGSIGKTFEH